MENHHKHIKRIRLHLYTVYAFTIVLLVMQIIMIYYFTIKISALQTTLDKESLTLGQRIDTDYIDMLSRVRELSGSLITLESGQSNIREQLGAIKATTSADFSGIVERSLQGVVTISTDVAQGSGFFVSDDGYVVTNAHILFRGRYAEVMTYEKNIYSAELIGYDIEKDIALLKVNGTFNSLALGDSDMIRVGEKVIAIGNPLGLSFTTTEGIISAIDRNGPSGDYYIQTDVSLNPGNSGGPLIDNSGQVIGINNFKLSNAESIGFALESNQIKKTVNEISMKALNSTLI